MRPLKKTPMWVLMAGVAWVAAVSFGMSRLLEYESTPGDSGLSPRRWPAGSRLRRDPLRPTLVLFAHPRCPCTRASLAELLQIITRCQGRVAAHVLFVTPEGVPPGWERTDLWRTAAAIPGVQVHRDAGDEARRFGAATSGHVALYDPQGGLLFVGGITGSRGHEGENAGSQAVIRLIHGEPAIRATSFVFGCSLR
jgi:hypothetical protein